MNSFHSDTMCNFQITLTWNPSEQPLSFAFNLVLITKQDSIPVGCISPACQPLPTPKDPGTTKTSATPRAVSYGIRVWPPPKKVTHQTSGRKRPQVDYSQYNVTDDPPSPPKKKRTVDLKRRPSAGRIAAEKYKTKSLNLPRPVRRRRPTTPNTPATTSIVTQPAKASTSSEKGTVMKPTTQRETDKVINQLLDIDMHQEENENDEYEVPLAPDQVHVQPSGILPNVDKVEQAAPDVEGANIKPLLLPRVLDTAIKIETPSNNEKPTPKKKVFKTVEYKLKRKYSKPRKFSCVKCVEKFESQKELNDHFRVAHLPVKCDLCQEHFDTPAVMLQHKYKHYDYMYECKICDKGFQFESQKWEHMWVHQTQGDWVCFKPKWGKHFKRASELNAHLFSHNKVPQKCEHCPYTNSDPRNLRAHMRKHSNVLPFKCSQCDKGFKWVQQHVRHLNSGKCPGPNN